MIIEANIQWFKINWFCCTTNQMAVNSSTLCHFTLIDLVLSPVLQESWEIRIARIMLGAWWVFSQL